MTGPSWYAPSIPDRDALRVVMLVGIVAGASLGLALGFLPWMWVVAGIAALAAVGAAACKPTWALAVMLLALPFEFVTLPLGPIASLSPVQLVSFLIFALVLAAAVVKGSLSLPRTPLDAIILLWIGIIFLSAIESLDPSATIKKAAMTTVLAISVYYTTIVNVRTTQRIRWLLAVLVLSSGIVGVYAIWASYRYLASGVITRGAILVGSEGLMVPRAASTAGNPSALAGLMVAVIPIALALFVISDRRAKPVALCGVAVLVISLALTFTRGAWLGTLAGALVLAVDRRFRATLLVLALVATALAPAVIFERAATTTQFGRGEITARFDYWQAALHMFERRPLLGVGTSNFAENFPRLPLAETAQRKAVHAHNIYLNILAENGALGLLTILALFGTALLSGFRYRDEDDVVRSLFRLAVVAGIAGFLVSQLTEFLLYDLLPAAVIWMLIALAVVLTTKTDSTGKGLIGRSKPAIARLDEAPA